MKKSFASFAMVGAVMMAAPAYAADEGLPQFNTALFPEQLFWLAIMFATLYVLMRFVALPGVESAQGKRKNVIESEIAAAKKANEEAKAMAHESDKALSEARANANATISAIKADASTSASEQQAAQSKQLGQRLREAEAGIAKARDAALKEIDGVAADLAASIVDQVAGMKVEA